MLVPINLDAKKVLPKIGGKRPGKRCKGGWISADKKCGDHKDASGKLTPVGKSAAEELAAKIRERKGMGSKVEANIAHKPLSELKAVAKGTNNVRQRNARAANFHGEAREKLNDRRTKAGLPKVADKPVAPAAKAVGKETTSPKLELTAKIAEVQTKPVMAMADIKTTGQAATYAKQEAAHQKAQGNATAAKAWEEEAKRNRIASLKGELKTKSTKQTNLLGVTEYASDMPLFS
jgi:hypothetical protein